MTDTVTLNVAGAAVTIPAKTLTDLWLDRVRAMSAPPTITAALIGPPAIGTPYGDGIYAGVVRGDAGERDYMLIVSENEVAEANWEAAKKWASEIDGGTGPWPWTLPRRKEQAILFGNVPELFAKEWYWSGELYAPVPAFAWAQDFYDGTQGYWRHLREFRARAVRRLPL